MSDSCSNEEAINASHVILYHASKQFAETQEQRKFDLCDRLASLITHNFTSSDGQSILSLDDQKVRRWCTHINCGLRDILASRLSDELRSRVFNLISALANAFKGFDWLLISESSDNDGQSSSQSVKIFPLLVKLICIDTCFVISGEVLESFSIGVRLMLLEYIILSMAEDEEQTNLLRDISPDLIISMCDSLSQTIAHLIDFLKTTADDWTTHKEDPNRLQIVFGCIRLICLWLRENSAAMDESLAGLSPFLNILIQDEKCRDAVGPFLASVLGDDPQLGPKLKDFKGEEAMKGDSSV
ncbi:uncharacterized protein LOC141853105 [Brevipalpus obovatus]|uniref:uncharacterized protein LOC141853105 n=1 Tax=Brevipalpus obovatus TaxID=246614 RepID=UPI003D9E5929